MTRLYLGDVRNPPEDGVTIDEAVVWLEANAPDALDDLRLLGAHRFGGDTPMELIMAAYERERRKLSGEEQAL